MTSDFVSRAPLFVSGDLSRLAFPSGYTPQWLPRQPQENNNAPCERLVDAVVGRPTEEGGVLQQWQWLEALEYYAVSAPSGASWWDRRTDKSHTLGVPPAHDYEHLLR